MRLKYRTAVFALTVMGLVLAVSVLPQATALPSASTCKTPTLTKQQSNVLNKCNIKACELDKYFPDPRENPKYGGYIGKNPSYVQIYGYITKSMSRTTFYPLQTATVTLTVVANPYAGGFTMVEDYLPYGFQFDVNTFVLDGQTQTILLNNGFVRFRITGGGTHTIKYNIIAPMWYTSYYSNNYARVFWIYNGYVILFDYTFVQVLVVGTGIVMSTSAPAVKTLNYKQTCYKPATAK